MPKELRNTSVEDFDWSVYEKDGTFCENSIEKLTESYEKIMTSIKNHEVIKGTITSINKRIVIVNIGYKSDCVIPYSEILYNPNLKVGDEIEVLIEHQDNNHDQLISSHRKARHIKSWSRINEAFSNNEIVSGIVKCRYKCGMIVDILGVEAFLPDSQIDILPIRDYNLLVNRTLEFKIVKINQEPMTVFISHRVLIEDRIIKESWPRIVQAFIEKSNIDCIVEKKTEEGYIVDVYGMKSILPLALSEGFINENTIGKSIEAKIIKVQEQTHRFVVSSLYNDRTDAIAEDCLKSWSISKNNIDEFDDYVEEMFEDDYSWENEKKRVIKRFNHTGAYTYGRLRPCPYCGSNDVSLYCDGSAECNHCGGEYNYA